ncbi:hypothetical protein [Yoonia sp.]|uniref:hypothetical protein n=1 Tax=Yoonia sp. TaxID=2212373 RepID=UPI0019FB0299|nr:hypothetical protein [Yoonia sp.]MBE0413316.1 hypothetical protein [Yoonia sp.]
MSDISALESRITAALDRIRQGIEAQKSTLPADHTLSSALENERAANAELVERVRQLKERQDTQVASLVARVESQRVQMIRLDEELQRLRASNTQMREMNSSLREALSNGVAPELLDNAMAAEVEALAAQRASEAAEVDAILRQLKPLIEGDTHAAG